MRKKPLILAVVALVSLGGIFLWWLMKMNQDSLQNALKEEMKTTENIDTENVDTSDWKIYRNEEYGFEVKYPDIEEHLKSIGGWTDNNEPRITSKTSFNYSECAIAGEGPGMNASVVIIAGREYCLITAFSVEPGTFSTQYEYVSRIGNVDVGIVFSVSGRMDEQKDEQKVDKEARVLFSQILSTFKFTK